MDLKKALEKSNFFISYNSDVLERIEEIAINNDQFKEEYTYFADGLEQHQIKLLYGDIHYICFSDKVLIEFGNTDTFNYKKDDEFLITYLLLKLITSIADLYELSINITAIKINGFLLTSLKTTDEYQSYPFQSFDNFIEIFYLESDESNSKPRYKKTAFNNSLNYHLKAYTFEFCSGHYENKKKK